MEKVGGRLKGTGKGKVSALSMSICDYLFHGEENPTPVWIMDRLIHGKKYNDRSCVKRVGQQKSDPTW